jgi:hypothetical protein
MARIREIRSAASWWTLGASCRRLVTVLPWLARRAEHCYYALKSDKLCQLYICVREWWRMFWAPMFDKAKIWQFRLVVMFHVLRSKTCGSSCMVSMLYFFWFPVPTVCWAHASHSPVLLLRSAPISVPTTTQRKSVSTSYQAHEYSSWFWFNMIVIFYVCLTLILLTPQTWSTTMTMTRTVTTYFSVPKPIAPLEYFHWPTSLKDATWRDRNMTL